MSDSTALSTRAALEQALRACGPLAVAVSGGVDSLTLAVLAHRLTADALLVHATSPAVPAEATARVRDWARREGWRLEVVDAGEFADPAYRANPVNRCFFCKTNLYGSIGRISGSGRQIVSGANTDDLAEYRPGLDAAREHRVRHPYVEAGFDKASVRRLAAALGLGSVAELPSSPCLSSRVETGIAIDPRALASIHAVERWVDAALSPRTVRCRLRAEGVVVELDPATLARLAPADLERLADGIRGLWSAGADADADAGAGAGRMADAGDRLAAAGAAAANRPAAAEAITVDQGRGPAGEPAIRFAPYRTGSAFLTGAGTAMQTLQPLKVLR